METTTGTTEEPGRTRHSSRAELEEARGLLAGITYTTPLQESRALSNLAGCRVIVKCENLQVTGSFKLRGAYVRLSRLNEQQRARGVVAASAGNHAQGVAYAARELGIKARIFMPRGVALPKLAATLEYGADVELVTGELAAALVAAEEYAETSGRAFISPFDHIDTVMGQASVGLELLEQAPDVGTILVPTGGGGLLAGVACAVQAAGASTKVVGVQAARAAAFPASLAEGRPVPLARTPTIADGIAVAAPSDLTLRIAQDLVTEVVTVTENDIARAVLLLAERGRLVVEPSGAAGVAALLHGPARWEAPIAVVLSGGNIDTLMFNRILRYGLVTAGRYVRMEVQVSDRPGSLAALLAVLASSESNVVNVNHSRITRDLDLSEVRIGVELETKGHEHCQEVLTALRAEGYGVSVAANDIEAADGG